MPDSVVCSRSTSLTIARAPRGLNFIFLGLVFDADNLKVGQYLTGWLADSVQDTVKHTTYESYERLVRIHLVPTLGRIKLKNLAPAHVRRLYRDKLDSGLSATSVQQRTRPLAQSTQAGRR
jgi:hypothetical protein